jgi:2-succinyl-6-hydroxy-2,4-cyclohexadiene-1-carboxylate synthase
MIMQWPYLTRGQPDKPVLILLHGFMGSGKDWLPLAERRLAPHFFCVMPTLPGHGQHKPGSILTFDTVVDGLLRLVEQVSSTPVNMLGYSMGGRITLYFAHNYPSYVSRLVLEGAGPGIAGLQARYKRATLDDTRAEQIEKQGIDTFVSNWYQMDMFATLAHHPQKLAHLMATRKKNNPAWAGQVISRLSPGRQPALWSALPALNLPVLLVAGELDRKYAAVCREMVGLLPNGRLVLVPGAGHNTHLEQPEKFIQPVVEFLL